MPNKAPDVGQLEAVLRGAVPPVKSELGSPVCGDIDIRIARDGTWFYHGSPIGRKRLVKLFSTVVRREADGQFYLLTPVEKGRIQVDDAPFIGVELTQFGKGPGQALHIRTNVDDVVTVNEDHPIEVVHDLVTGEPSPYVRVRDNLDALIARSVYYELAAMAEESEAIAGTFGVWSQGTFFSIGTAAADA